MIRVASTLVLMVVAASATFAAMVMVSGLSG